MKLNLTRFNDRWGELKAELSLLWRELVAAHLVRTMSLIIFAMIFSGTFLYIIEGVIENRDTFANPLDAIWWAIVTMSTVGYGDITPQGPIGKISAIVVILSGVALFSFFTATVSSVFVAAKIREGKGLQEVVYTDHLVICGWNPGAERVIEALRAMSKGTLRLVFINDMASAQIEELIENFKDMRPRFVRGDFSHATILRRAGVEKAQAVILLPDMNAGTTAAQVDQKTTLAALSVRDVNPKAKVFAYALEVDSIPHLHRGGVDRVVLRDAYQPYLLACHALAPGIPEVVDELLTFDRGNRFVRVPIPEKYIGETVSTLTEWARTNMNGTLIGLLNEEKVIEVEDILSEDLSSIDAFIKRKFEEAGRSAEELAQTRIKINPDPTKIIQQGEIAIVIQRTDKEPAETKSN